VIKLKELRTAAEVHENYRAVRERVKQWGRAAPPAAIEAPLVPDSPPEQAPKEPPPRWSPPVVVPIIIPLTRTQEIKRLVCQQLGVERSELVSARRTDKLTFARAVAYFLLRDRHGKSLPEIGRRFGGRDHTTVLHAIKKLERRIRSEPETERLIAELQEKLDDAEADSSADARAPLER